MSSKVQSNNKKKNSKLTDDQWSALEKHILEEGGSLEDLSAWVWQEFKVALSGSALNQNKRVKEARRQREYETRDDGKFQLENALPSVVRALNENMTSLQTERKDLTKRQKALMNAAQSDSPEVEKEKRLEMTAINGRLHQIDAHLVSYLTVFTKLHGDHASTQALVALQGGAVETKKENTIETLLMELEARKQTTGTVLS